MLSHDTHDVHATSIFSACTDQGSAVMMHIPSALVSLFFCRALVSRRALWTLFPRYLHCCTDQMISVNTHHFFTQVTNLRVFFLMW